MPINAKFDATRCSPTIEMFGGQSYQSLPFLNTDGIPSRDMESATISDRASKHLALEMSLGDGHRREELTSEFIIVKSLGARSWCDEMNCGCLEVYHQDRNQVVKKDHRESRPPGVLFCS